MSDGSSPLARGLQVEHQGRVLNDGIIPARAGFTERSSTHTPAEPDHPRSRGVYDWASDRVVPGKGSSPLARGLLMIAPISSAFCRIIPARAGFTRCHGNSRPSIRDHPRSRGVYTLGCVVTIIGCGSSPLARGLPGLTGPVGIVIGIIPARAGFTRTSPTGGGQRPQDHPRSRGVYGGLNIAAIWADGSSPLARGLRRVSAGDIDATGIIPARAGFTWPSSPPRGATVGSSPLARGLRLQDLPELLVRGIIPARAGFTSTISSRTTPTTDHPRSRGVYLSIRHHSYLR